jgi:hypothetical protein
VSRDSDRALYHFTGRRWPLHRRLGYRLAAIYTRVARGWLRAKR